MKARVRHLTGSPLAGPGERLPVPQAAGGPLEQARARFPARAAGTQWLMTCRSADEVLAALQMPPYVSASVNTCWYRLTGARAILDWLATFPGTSWQERWEASPAATCPRAWADHGYTWVSSVTEVKRRSTVLSGLLLLAGADVLRLPLAWLAGHSSNHLRDFVEEVRDPAGYARLKAHVGPKRWQELGGGKARRALARILLAKGGDLADITVGDAIEHHTLLRGEGGSSLFYSWLRELGHLPSDAPATLRLLGRVTGQLTTGQLVDRHGVACAPIRELLIDYLEERRPRLDYASMDGLARNLTRNFWSDLERHHPGIASLDLPPEVAAAWKERLRTRIQRRRRPDGTVEETVVERADQAMVLMSVRALYLDVARWAAEEPARWGPWAAPCPIKEAETLNGKRTKRIKARMDQRTHERLPALDTFARAALDHHRHRLACLEALRSVPRGVAFTVEGGTFVRTTHGGDSARDAASRLIHFDLAEHRAFWAWAAVEFLRHTGARIEEMLEASHHALVQYRLPTTGEIVPLLQIAPSKTDQERVLLVSPELADVLSAVIRRVRDPQTGAIPLLAAYDYEERIWSPPAPLLFQWDRAGEPSRMTGELIRRALGEVLDFIGLTDASGQPLDFAPHDFRRMFITDAIRSGLPPHIAQVIVGHSDINTTMGYNAVYPTETIEAHRAFITRRRTLRPAEEYRTPTDSEWEDFLGHFERRKLSVGTCARAYGTACIHEHACVRCSLLRPDPAQRGRLVEIRDNLLDRIAEAEREGWLGEIEGLRVSLAGAESKIGQIDRAASGGPVLLGLPTPRPAQQG